MEQFERGASRLLVGLKPRERTPVRAGVLLYAAVSAFESVGTVTSGTFGLTVAGPVAMGYVPTLLEAEHAVLCGRKEQPRYRSK